MTLILYLGRSPETEPSPENILAVSDGTLDYDAVLERVRTAHYQRRDAALFAVSLDNGFIRSLFSAEELRQDANTRQHKTSLRRTASGRRKLGASRRLLKTRLQSAFFGLQTWEGVTR